MAAYDYSPDGRKIADRREECPVTERLELWLEARSFRLVGTPRQAETIDQLISSIAHGYLPPGTAF